MAYNYQFTDLASRDIDETLDYISQNLHNPAAARDLYQSLEVAIPAICALPYGFPDCTHYQIDNKNIRHTQVGNYLLFYRISEEEKKIEFLRFLYGRRNIAGMSSMGLEQ